MLIHGAPQVMSRAIDLAEDFSSVPFVARLRTRAAQRVSIDLAALKAPLRNSFVGQVDAVLCVTWCQAGVAGGEGRWGSEQAGDLPNTGGAPDQRQAGDPNG